MPFAGEGPLVGEIELVRSPATLTAWHGVYCEGLGVDERSHDDWQRLQTAVGAMGEQSFVLMLARSGGEPAAVAATFIDDETAGFYCFATRRAMRRRGLATKLLLASRDYALAAGASRGVLHATDSGKPVYAKAGFQHADDLTVLVRRQIPLGKRSVA
jgi:GNAT superfamily N-acetyltransferase